MRFRPLCIGPIRHVRSGFGARVDVLRAFYVQWDHVLLGHAGLAHRTGRVLCVQPLYGTHHTGNATASATAPHTSEPPRPPHKSKQPPKKVREQSGLHVPGRDRASCAPPRAAAHARAARSKHTRHTHASHDLHSAQRPRCDSATHQYRCPQSVTTGSRTLSRHTLHTKRESSSATDSAGFTCAAGLGASCILSLR